MKTTYLVRRLFPNSQAVLVQQDGSRRSMPSKGAVITLRTREDEDSPWCAEVISGEHYAEIGLSFEGRQLADYDGEFFLPREAGEMLRDAGYYVPVDCFARLA